MTKSVIVRSRSEACVDSGKGFISTTGPSAAGEGDVKFALFIAGAGKVTRITKFILGVDNARRWRLLRDPTVTGNGTAQTGQNKRFAKGQSPVSILYLTPTVTADGSLLSDYWNQANVPAIIDMVDSPWILDPGEKLLFVTSGGATQNASVTVEWDEEPT
jgi:hypothetical protein